MRLIEADALTKRLVEFCNKNCPYTAKARNVMCGRCFMGLALEAVEHAPTIEPERKKGKWLPDNNNYYEERFICSVCGKSYNVDTCMGKPMWDFCPCGADMREEGDNE